LSDEFLKLAAKRMDAPCGEFYEIESDEAILELEAMEFCKGLVETLNNAIPVEFANRKFYKWEKQKEDIHICWGLKNPIAIQIDPLCEVICALDNEFGCWAPDDDAVVSFLYTFQNQNINSV